MYDLFRLLSGSNSGSSRQMHMLYKFHVTQRFFFVRHHYYYYYYYYDVQSQLTAAAAMIGGAEVVHLSHK